MGLVMTKYLILLTFLITNCVSYDRFNTSTAEGSFGLAQELEKDERYEESLAQYRDVKNRFPYSRFAIASELQIAEIQFKKEAFIEAQGAYQLFKELHPRHEKIDYVTYQIGLSIYNQLPDTEDRDLSIAPLAIKEFDVLLRDYPQSPYATKAAEKRLEVIDKLALKEIYIADFYYRTKAWQYALSRYEKYLREFSSHNQRAHAYLRAGLSAEKLGDENKRNTILRKLISELPSSKEAQRAQRML